MTKSNRASQRIKNYYRVKEALYSHFPKDAIYDVDYSCTIYLYANYFFKEKGQFLLIYYDGDRLLYPHHLDYVADFNDYKDSVVYNNRYIGVAPFDENNKIMNSNLDYISNFYPTEQDIENVCGFISHELTRMKEYIKLNKIKDDF